MERKFNAKTSEIITAIFFTDLVLGVSISDLSDRANGCYFRAKGDTEMLIYTIVIVILWLIISHKLIKKHADNK